MQSVGQHAAHCRDGVRVQRRAVRAKRCERFAHAVHLRGAEKQRGRLELPERLGWRDGGEFARQPIFEAAVHAGRDERARDGHAERAADLAKELLRRAGDAEQRLRERVLHGEAHQRHGDAEPEADDGHAGERHCDGGAFVEARHEQHAGGDDRAAADDHASIIEGPRREIACDEAAERQRDHQGRVHQPGIRRR